MNVFQKIENWGNAHRPGWLVVFRIALGAVLTYKGVQFMFNFPDLQMTIGGIDAFYVAINVAHYVLFAHIIGGLLIIFGLYTRVAVVFQIPVLIGAVFLVNYPKGFLSLGNHMELELSIAVLVLLIVFLIFGAGKFSIDQKRRKEKEAKQDQMGSFGSVENTNYSH